MNSNQFRKNPSNHRIEYEQTLKKQLNLRFPVHEIHVIGLLVPVIHRVVHDEIITLFLRFILSPNPHFPRSFRLFPRFLGFLSLARPFPRGRFAGGFFPLSFGRIGTIRRHMAHFPALEARDAPHFQRRARVPAKSGPIPAVHRRGGRRGEERRVGRRI